MKNQILLIIDFGAHNNQRVAKIARGCNVYCEVADVDFALKKGKYKDVSSVILIGDDEFCASHVAQDMKQLKKKFANILPKGNLASEKKVKNFLFEKCKFAGDFTVEKYIDEAVKNIREQVGNKKVLCALSGGVDSSVCAALVNKAVGKQLTCMFVNQGLMRKGEPEAVAQGFGKEYNFVSIDATERFLAALEDVYDPEKKRKIIGKEFIRVFEEESAKLGQFDFLIQGTIYPDIIESISKKGVVKSHHNVGGLPKRMNLQLIEPLKWLFKDEVRKVGAALGLPNEQVNRQPFPGPGLGVRVVGEITREKLQMVRESDAILREEIANAGWDKKIWQFFTLCPGCKSTGVKDGRRTYGETIAIRAIISTDAMSAEVAQIPYDLLTDIAAKIVENVEGVSRVVYDVTPKPPATIEWE